MASVNVPAARSRLSQDELIRSARERVQGVQLEVSFVGFLEFLWLLRLKRLESEHWAGVWV